MTHVVWGRDQRCSARGAPKARISQQMCALGAQLPPTASGCGNQGALLANPSGFLPPPCSLRLLPTCVSLALGIPWARGGRVVRPRFSTGTSRRALWCCLRRMSARQDPGGINQKINSKNNNNKMQRSIITCQTLTALLFKRGFVHPP